MQPFESARLRFRPLHEDDTPGMFELDSDPAVHRYLGGIGGQMVTESAQSLEVIRYVQAQYVNGGIGRWAVTLRTTGEFMGWAGLKKVAGPINGHHDFYDLGYRFIPRYWDQGYGFEAAQAWLNYGFQHLALPRISGYADAENAGSCRILEKIGLRRANEFVEAGVRCVWFEADNLTPPKVG
ncbi:GNAT family N-acetyltransferase [Hymenobacter arizonensis]|uniref:Protein N-acetyltransferase, RimJ/RimL family n=1 Tax=Hymenobacter arizonensis TaxID=1227077 RepID=A0A1I6ATK6_HYMAR|nr:GNAT family N-acetyltransferase [Hymenobacter arizonensis]SFQ71999.1 Protein N-acetyltransferase, RimJ/RimL family [Hymenobacter arizonensis]